MDFSEEDMGIMVERHHSEHDSKETAGQGPEGGNREDTAYLDAWPCGLLAIASFHGFKLRPLLKLKVFLSPSSAIAFSRQKSCSSYKGIIPQDSGIVEACRDLEGQWSFTTILKLLNGFCFEFLLRQLKNEFEFPSAIQDNVWTIQAFSSSTWKHLPQADSVD